MSSGVDISDFSLGIDIEMRELEEDVSLITKKTAIDLYGRIISKTPVDSGRAQNSWFIKEGSPDESVLEEGEYGELDSGSATAKANADLGKLGKYPTVFITNNLEYIGYLEDGSSTQAPSGMVSLSMEEVKK